MNPPASSQPTSAIVQHFNAFRAWLLDVNSDDPSVQRRARTFIPLVAVLIATSTVSTTTLIFASPNPYVNIQYMMIISSLSSNVAAIMLARKGWMNLAGFVSGGVTLIAFFIASLMEPSLLLALGWFYGVGVLLASYAMKPRFLAGMWIFAQGCLSASFATIGAPQVGQPNLWYPTMGTLLLFITLASYLHARATEAIFKQQLESARQLELARRDAEQANRAKSAFLANMSHELRTPLNAILGYSEMLAEDFEDDPYTKKDLDRIHSSGTHLLTLINDVLDLSKIEAGKMDLLVEAFNFEEMIEHISSTMGSVVSRKQNKLVCQISPSCGHVATDRTKVRQVILNVLSNASKFTENGTITLAAKRISRDGKRLIEVAITDTGIGMDDEQLSRVFKEFEQADKSTTKEYGGTGLGLALCKRICQLLEGDIHATSQPGIGSTFTFTFTAEHSETPEDVAGELAQKGAASNHPMLSGLSENSVPIEDATILVIDDDPDSHALLTRTLKKEGFTLLSATTGEQGFELIQQNPDVDVILLDILMPGESGWQVLHRLKNDPLTQHIPVVLMSVIDEQQRGLSLGASDYVMKPVNRQRLLDSISRLTAIDPDQDHLKALIVEDDSDTREILSRILAAEHWETKTANNGLEALSSLQNFMPDVILLDLMMPKMDGFQVLGHLRENPLWQHIPVVIVTAKVLSPEEHNFLRQGAAHILQKGQMNHQLLIKHARAAIIDHQPRA